MRAAVVLCNSYLVAMVVLLGRSVEEAHACDTKWIRLVYMMSCGKKKRESVWAQNDTFYENLPLDFDGAFNYYKDRDPFNPLFKDEAFYEILKEDDVRKVEQRVPKLLLFGGAEENPGRVPGGTTGGTPQSSSVLLGKLFPRTMQTRGNNSGNHLGIQGFPAQWDIEEIVDEKINDNRRREIDRLIEECCKVPPVTTCNGNTFSGACK